MCGKDSGEIVVLRISIISIKGLIRTVATTRNFWTAVIFSGNCKKKAIFFRDGSTFRLTWSQYWKVREIKQAGYTILQISDDLFKIKDNTITLVGSSDMLQAVGEIDSGFYDWDYQGKVVLDIGGFQGESAVFFFKNGAKKIIIYEPVEIHQELIKQNILLNKVNAEIHGEGIGNHDCIETISYQNADLGFRLDGIGQHKMQIKIRNLTDIIEKSHADIAKFNCEGAEKSIMSLDSVVLRKIDVYLIMAHSKQISEMIIAKFKQSGFELVRRNLQQSFICFKKKDINLN